jgi:hypothetical protein
MTWQEVVGKIAEAAPMVGSLLGPGGTAVGGIIAMAASALGCAPTQDAITQTIAANPDAILKLKELELTHAVELQKLVVLQEQNQLAAETQEILAVNATMQSESKSEHWPQYSWRPFWGFISAAAFAIFIIFVCYLGQQAIIGKDPNAMVMIPQIITSMVMLFGIPGAILGIASFKRGNMQIEQAKRGDTPTNP